MKLIALYLPQFHEFEENNNWWGKGFTEWTCVNRAVSLCVKHRIKKPHADIGYYNLLNYKVRKKQSEIARKFGIYGFCYYHYWFGNKVLMDSPLKLMLQDGEPSINYCFNWANEPWTRRMNGGNGEILQDNNYGFKDEWEQHFRYLLPYFKSDNYIKIHNKPLFAIYRPSLIPNLKERIEYYRNRSKQEGFNGIFFLMTIAPFFCDENYMHLMDGCFDFYPNFFRNKKLIVQETEKVCFYDMNLISDYIKNSKSLHKNHFKGLLVGFDSSPRSPNKSNVILNESPEAYYDLLNYQIKKSNQEFIFVNGWNEWGEGCALEPEMIDNYRYLEYTKKTLKKL